MDKLKKDAHGKEVNDMLQKDIKFAVEKDQFGTPSMKMGDEFQMGVKGYPKLKEWIIKHGGKPKHKFL